MANQNSPCCHMPICICGEAYRHLNDHNLSLLASVLTSQLADRLSEVHQIKRPTRTWPTIAKVPDTPKPQTTSVSKGYSLADVSKLLGDQPPVFNYSLRDAHLYPLLQLGDRFKFDVDVKGEWVVTKIVFFDEDRGPRLQVASVTAQCGEEVMAFYTSYSDNLVDETMVPFYSMHIIGKLPGVWEPVPEPAEHSYAALQVGSTLGPVEYQGHQVVFTVTSAVFLQKNGGLGTPSQTATLVTVEDNDTSDNFKCELCVIDWEPTDADLQGLRYVKNPICHIRDLATVDKRNKQTNVTL